MKNPRAWFLQGLFLFFALAILGRLFFWQVINYDEFVTAAANQHLTTVSIGADRGKILSFDLEVLVANQPSFLLFANLQQLKDSEKGKKDFGKLAKDIVDDLAPLLAEEKISDLKKPEKATTKEKKKILDSLKRSLTESLETENVVWVALAHKLTEKTKEKIEKLGLVGLGFEEQASRFYPNGSLAAQLLGFVGEDEDGNDRGYSGLEGFYDDQLRGRVGKLTEEVDAQGHPILAGLKSGAVPADGFDLVTTIDRTVQYTVERYLRAGMKKYSAKSGSAIVMDIKTGAILAVANVPSFDPSKWFSFENKDLRNGAISDVYEPGSTFKMITAAAALDSGAITTETVCPCTGPIKIAGYEIRTWNNQYHSGSTVSDILEHSDNVGASFMAEKVGKAKFIDYVKKFGFGKKTGVDLQGEETGLLKDPADWYPIDYVTSAFGQGISVTSLQMLTAASAIANGGKMMQPYLVQKIIGEKTIEHKPVEVGQIIKPKTASVMKELLFSAVENGEAKRLIPHGLRVAGKTGTAQIPIAGHYDPNKTVASFVGFGPVEKPKFAMIVRFNEPIPIYAAETSEPLFFDIARELYSYWGIAIH
ncbi:MAG: penicillin-binding protein 2 [bacterium]|nr:penicillin-binding protein 2 [bacterium]